MAEEENTDRRKDLDKEISMYISGRRKKKRTGVRHFLKKLKRRPKKKVEFHPEVAAYGEEAAKKKRKAENDESEEEAEKVEEEFEEGAKKKTFWEWLKSKFSSEKKVEVEDMEKEFEEVPEKMTEEEIKEEKELETEYKEEVKKEGFFSRLFGKFFVKTREEEEFQEASDQIAEDYQDMKTIAQIATKALKMLPAKEMKAFKESDDFVIFKEILKKRNLIK